MAILQILSTRFEHTRIGLYVGIRLVHNSEVLSMDKKKRQRRLIFISFQVGESTCYVSTDANH